MPGSRSATLCPSTRTVQATSGVALRTVTVSPRGTRSEEHTSELQSHHDLVCRLLLEKKKGVQTSAADGVCSRASPCSSAIGASYALFPLTLARCPGSGSDLAGIESACSTIAAHS